MLSFTEKIRQTNDVSNYIDKKSSSCRVLLLHYGTLNYISNYKFQLGIST